MRAALVMVDLVSGEHYCHVFEGGDPLQRAHAMYNTIRFDFLDFEPAFVADEPAKRRYGQMAVRRATQLYQEAEHTDRKLETAIAPSHLGTP